MEIKDKINMRVGETITVIGVIVTPLERKEIGEKDNYIPPHERQKAKH